MRAKKTPSKSSKVSKLKKRATHSLKKVNNIDELFTKKDIKNIVDSVVNHNPL